MAKLNRRKFCECGCGLVVKPGNRFVHGHNNARLGTGKPISPSQLCLCGCGFYTKPGRIFINNHHHGKPISKPIIDHHLCACGKCGILVPSNLQYVHGHNRFGKNNWENVIRKHLIPIPNHHLCECGLCDKLVASDKRFAKGHFGKGKIGSGMSGHNHKEETLQKMRRPRGKLKQPRGPQSEEQKLHRSETNSKPEVKAKHKQACINAQNRPDVRKANSEAQKIAQNRLGVKEKKIQSAAITNAKPETYKRRSISNKEAQNRPEVKATRIKKTKDLWQDPEFAKMMVKSWFIKPTKPEILLNDCFNEWLPQEWKYTGDGSFWINGKNPDFVNCNGQKKIIEFNGNYWHQNDIPGKRESIFAKFGYDTLILSDEDLLDKDKLKIKVIDFHLRENPYVKHGEI